MQLQHLESVLLQIRHRLQHLLLNLSQSLLLQSQSRLRLLKLWSQLQLLMFLTQ